MEARRCSCAGRRSSCSARTSSSSRGARLRRYARGDHDGARDARARCTSRTCARASTWPRRTARPRPTCSRARCAPNGEGRATAGERMVLAPHKGEPRVKTSPVAHVGGLDGRARDDRSRRGACAVRRRHRRRAQAGRAGLAALPARDPEARRARHDRGRLRGHRGRRDLLQPELATVSRASTASARRTARRCTASASIATASSSGGTSRRSRPRPRSTSRTSTRASTEDPALLEWDAPGVYRARLYPIGPGETRRVVVRYAEWLGRTGPKGERRLYVYPMAAEGAEGSLPHIEELTATIDLSRRARSEVRVGHDRRARGRDDRRARAGPRAPRRSRGRALRRGARRAARLPAPHTIDLETLPPTERAEAMTRARTEADYVLVPVRAADVPLAKGGLDLAIVIDTSAATDAPSLAIARAATAALARAPRQGRSRRRVGGRHVAHARRARQGQPRRDRRGGAARRARADEPPRARRRDRSRARC